jgi:hypothetical protein
MIPQSPDRYLVCPGVRPTAGRRFRPPMRLIGKAFGDGCAFGDFCGQVQARLDLGVRQSRRRIGSREITELKEGSRAGFRGQEPR